MFKNVEKIKELRADLEEANEELDETRSELTSVKRQLVKANEDNAILRESYDNSLNNKRKALELDRREKVLKAREESLKSFQQEIESLQEEVRKAEEKGHRIGYAGGVADGMRKGMDLTKDDRLMMAQIAAIAAASHVPEATTMIAKEVATGIAKDLQSELPATTSSKNK